MRRIPALFLLLLCAALLLTGCEALGQAGRENGTSRDAFYRLIDDCRKEGDRFSRLLMDETASYFYGFAGASVSAMRLAVERILWLKGEGDDFESLAAESLREIDRCAQDCLRYLISGRHTKARFNVRYGNLKALGCRSLVHEYYRGLKEASDQKADGESENAAEGL